MTNKETIKKLEKMYKVHIDRAYTWDMYGNKEIELFAVYSMDGCKWDNVIGYRSLRSMLAEDKASLRRLANLQKMIDTGVA